MDINFILGTTNKEKVLEFVKYGTLYNNEMLENNSYEEKNFISFYLLDDEIYEEIEKVGDAIENGKTFEENAQKKADFIVNLIEKYTKDSTRNSLRYLYYDAKCDRVCINSSRKSDLKDMALTKQNTYFNMEEEEEEIKKSVTCLLVEDSGLEMTWLGGKPSVYSKRFLGTNSSFKTKVNILCEELKEKVLPPTSKDLIRENYNCDDIVVDGLPTLGGGNFTTSLKVVVLACNCACDRYLKYYLKREYGVTNRMACKLHNHIEEKDLITFISGDAVVGFGYNAWLEPIISEKGHRLRQDKVSHLFVLDKDTNKKFLSLHNMVNAVEFTNRFSQVKNGNFFIEYATYYSSRLRGLNGIIKRLVFDSKGIYSDNFLRRTKFDTEIVMDKVKIKEDKGEIIGCEIN